jgi:hypothetical protein
MPETAMNDPFGPKPDKLILDTGALIKKILGLPNIKLVIDSASRIELFKVHLRDSPQEIGFDYLLSTLALPLFGSLLGDEYIRLKEAVSTARTNTLSILRCMSLSMRYCNYDYVYTPSTPGDMIHRISLEGTAYSVETAKPLTNLNRLFSDLIFLFGEPLVVGGSTIPGHILPTVNMDTVNYLLPDHWIMMGRYAQWDSRRTVDKVWSRARDINVGL